MFGLKIISSSEYDELNTHKEKLGDRVLFLESDRSNADKTLKKLEDKLQNALSESERHKNALLGSREFNANQIEELQGKLDRSHEVNERLEQDLDQACESVANLQKAIAEVKQQLSDSQSRAKELEGQNQNQINTIATFVSQCDEAEKERNELIIEKGVSRANFENYQRNVAIAVDNLQIEIEKLSPVEVSHES